MLHGLAGLFERAVALDKSWEKGYFSYAVYLDQLMRDARQRQTAFTASRSSVKGMDRLGGRSRYFCISIIVMNMLLLITTIIDKPIFGFLIASSFPA